MPLDPFFEERLRVHRKYLFGQALGSLRKRLGALWPFGRTVVPTPRPAPPPVEEDKPKKAKRALTAREKHRRAALAWDRAELKNVGTPGPDIRTVEHRVDVVGRPAVRVRVYYPPLTGDAPVPAVLAFFGGAFRIGGIDYPTTDAAFRRRAVDAEVIVVAVDYSLAPEHRYPTQVEQGYAALIWLFEHARELGVDPERVGLLGTSAGAGLAAAVSLANRDRAALPLRLQVLEVRSWT
jgi:acetyl esterase